MRKCLTAELNAQHGGQVRSYFAGALGDNSSHTLVEQFVFSFFGLIRLQSEMGGEQVDEGSIRGRGLIGERAPLEPEQLRPSIDYRCR